MTPSSRYITIYNMLRDFQYNSIDVTAGLGEAALNILTRMCEYGVLKQTHIEGVRYWKNRPIMKGPYSVQYTL